MQIKLIPNNLRKIITENKLPTIIGYKKISKNKKITLVEIINKNRLWLLETETKS